jgi:hypothetical protein
MHGHIVLNYIDVIIGIAPHDVTDTHFQLTVDILLNLGFNLNNSKRWSLLPLPFA